MYTQKDIRAVQLRLLTMGKSICSILENNGIPYFITYGTLLGAVRHQGFIPWDDDFDLYLFSDSYENAISTLRKELPKNYFVEDKKTEPLYFHAWTHVKDLNSVVHCDLFPQDNAYTHHGISVDLYKATKMPENKERLFRLTEHLDYLNRKHDVHLIDEDSYRQKTMLLQKEIVQEKDRLHTENGLLRELYTFPSIYDDRLYPEELLPLKRYRFEDTEFYGPCNAEIFLSRCYGDYMSLPPIEKRRPHYSEVTFLL